MIREGAASARSFRTVVLDADLVVAGGGMAGTCCAITAARAGAKVVLIQDRPVLGGNASSEVRLWVLGATAHGYNNNRWAREGGVLDEILVENLWRNRDGNPVIFDTIVLEKAVAEPTLTLLLNTAVDEVLKSGPDTIAGVRAFCSQNSTRYEARAPLFCDATGDGAVGFLAGAAFRMGAEAEAEFGEKFAPSKEYGELLGHTIYFYSKDAGRPVTFVPPAYALTDITKIPKWRSFAPKEYGPNLWWIEWGGRLDTVHDTETIKWELWKVVYGVWNHIKNSGKFPEAANLTLEWVGQIPGKRESRRFEGGVWLTQHDIVDQRRHPDDVAFGGWSIDLHPADGIYSEKPSCDQWHAKGIYGIPYRCLYSANIANLFLTGRILSATHVAFGSTRVMATLAHTGQAVGMAAAMCARERLKPADLVSSARMPRLQQALLRSGQHIPDLRLDDPEDLARAATVTATSRFLLDFLPADGPWITLERDWAQMIPVPAGSTPKVGFTIRAQKAAKLTLQLRRSGKPRNHTPDVTMVERVLEVGPGESKVSIGPGPDVPDSCYLFAVLLANAGVDVRASTRRVSGLLSVHHHDDQKPTYDLGVETFEFWAPKRRPEGHNLAVTVEPPVDLFGPENVRNGIDRPVASPNAWVAAPDDATPALTLTWKSPVTIARVELAFDADFDHPLESVVNVHPERAVPFCVKRWRLLDGGGRVLAERDDWHQARATLRLDPPLTTDQLRVELVESRADALRALLAVRVYGADRVG